MKHLSLKIEITRVKSLYPLIILGTEREATRRTAKTQEREPCCVRHQGLGGRVGKRLEKWKLQKHNIRQEVNSFISTAFQI